MIKRFFALVLVALSCNLVTMAVPAYPVRKMVRLSDGTQVLATLRGDEFCHYYETDNGVCLRQLPDGRFTRIYEDQLSVMKEEAMSMRNEANMRRSRTVAQKKATMTGKKKGLVILVHFQDNEFSIENPRTEFLDFFNQKGYRKFGMQGSVSDYFREQSYGAFDLEFDVVGPYKLSQNMAYYGQQKGDKHDEKPQDMIKEAVIHANADVDYGKYDWDGDGEVDQVFVIYAGYGQNYGGDPNAIWPHEWVIDLDMKFDGKTIRTYACANELKGTQGTVLEGIGSACHEFSHCLGIHDHYDTKGDNFGMGSWDVMCSGNYNDSNCTPAAYTAYERWICGWLEPVEIKDVTEIKGMKPLVDAPEAYILYNEGNRNEYYLLENRQLKSFDAGLPGHGLLVVHVDYDEASWGGNTVNVGDKQRMTIVAADDVYSYSARSLSADTYPGTGRVTSLTDYSSPAAVVYEKNKDRSYLMHKPIECIEEDGDGLISMLVCAEPMSTPVVDKASDFTPNSFCLSWNAVEGAVAYELQLDERGRRGSLEDAILLNEDFGRCYSKTVGFTDISKNMSNYLTGFRGAKLFTTPDGLRIGTGTAAGSLWSPVFRALNTGDLTIVMKVKPFRDGTPVKGEVRITASTEESGQSFPFTLEKESTLVFRSYANFQEVFRVDIEPTSAMYISGLQIYDGHFSDEELGLAAQVKGDVEELASTSRAMAPNRAQVGDFRTVENNYEFTDLKSNCIYSVRLRACDQRGRVSDWSDWFEVDNPADVLAPMADAYQQGQGHGQLGETFFDLQGRRVGKPTHGLYIRAGKKVMVK